MSFWEELLSCVDEHAASLGWLLTLVVAVVGGIWAYTKFVVVRGILPPAQFDVQLRSVGAQEGGQVQKVLEIVTQLRNLGSSPLVVRNLWIDLLYVDREDELELIQDHPGSAVLCGRLRFPRKLRDLLAAPHAVRKAQMLELGLCREDSTRRRRRRKAAWREPRGLPVAPYRTFVQPGVEQRYTYVTALPESASLVLVHAAFYYEPGGSPLQRGLFRLFQSFGLVGHTLRDVTMPHTCERVFKLDDEAPGPLSSGP